MLAQNFKTAEELGLTEKGLQAFIKLLGMLERGELIYTPYNQPIPNGFNMRRVWDVTECGTVGCLSGWVRALVGQKYYVYVADEAKAWLALNNLYMPPDWQDGKYTVEQAAHALRSYLVTGQPEWA